MYANSCNADRKVKPEQRTHTNQLIYMFKILHNVGLALSCKRADLFFVFRILPI